MKYNILVGLILVLFSLVSLFLYSNQIQFSTIAYWSTFEFAPVSAIILPASPSSSLSLNSQQLIDQISTKITETNSSITSDSVKRAVEKLALKTQGKGGNVEQHLSMIFEQVSQNNASPIANSIANLSLKEISDQQSAFNQQPQPTNPQQQTQASGQPTQTGILPQQNPKAPEQNATGQGIVKNGAGDLRSSDFSLNEPNVCYIQGDLGTEPIACKDSSDGGGEFADSEDSSDGGGESG